MAVRKPGCVDQFSDFRTISICQSSSGVHFKASLHCDPLLPYYNHRPDTMVICFRFSRLTSENRVHKEGFKIGSRACISEKHSLCELAFALVVVYAIVSDSSQLPTAIVLIMDIVGHVLQILHVSSVIKEQ